ncbi:MAG: nucleotide exchange factor GrpE [Defluviitaleaceae bacterium]|nr:nucleotide exchange factor GrpE [Defluviitaleaceae bacterium]
MDNENIESEQHLEETEDGVGEHTMRPDEQDETVQAEDFVAQLVDKLKHTVADYENYRKRSEKEKAGMYDRGIITFATELLPVMDNFALATKNADHSDNFVKGVLMIQSQLNSMFENMGITKIPAVGETFDTKFHNAVSTIEDESRGAQEIAEELQAGYIYKGAVIRHSVVVVAN